MEGSPSDQGIKIDKSQSTKNSSIHTSKPSIRAVPFRNDELFLLIKWLYWEKHLKDEPPDLGGSSKRGTSKLGRLPSLNKSSRKAKSKLKYHLC